MYLRLDAAPPHSARHFQLLYDSNGVGRADPLPCIAGLWTRLRHILRDWNRSWGGDNSNLSNVTNPWLKRGGRIENGSNAGVFASNNEYGNANVNNGSRAVLAGRACRS